MTRPFMKQNNSVSVVNMICSWGMNPADSKMKRTCSQLFLGPCVTYKACGDMFLLTVLMNAITFSGHGIFWKGPFKEHAKSGSTKYTVTQLVYPVSGNHKVLHGGLFLFSMVSSKTESNCGSPKQSIL